MTREEQVRTICEIAQLRKMLAVNSVVNLKLAKNDSKSPLYNIMGMLNQRRRNLREINDRHVMKKGGAKSRTMEAINRTMNTVAGLNKFRLDSLVIGGKLKASVSTFSQARRKRRQDGLYGELDIGVGYLWHKQVWETIHRHGVTSFICLQATEYRINVKAIRLYEAIVFKNHKIQKGWIGQSRYGSCKSAFNINRDEAIARGIKLAAAALTEQLGNGVSE